jgi:hypothetical protein
MALRCIKRPHLGDTVTYFGTYYILLQGCQAPYWDLLDKHRNRLNRIHEDNFRLQPLWKRFRFSFMFIYKFYMSNWYSIDIRRTGKLCYTAHYKLPQNGQGSPIKTKD